MQVNWDAVFAALQQRGRIKRAVHTHVRHRGIGIFAWFTRAAGAGL